MSFDPRAFFERMKDPATTPEQLEELALQIPPELIRDACTLKAEGMSDVKISRILNKMLAARREAKGEAEPSASDTAGSDLELPVAVTLHEAYLGTTRKFTATLSNGQKHIMELAIPPGVDTGTRVRFRGYGAPGQAGGKPGDLYLVISVSPFPNFARRGNDLFSRLTVPPALLLTGGKVPVRTLDSTAIALTIPAGTKHGQLFRLSGQGMPLLRQPTQRGDLDLRILAGEPCKSEQELLVESQSLNEATTRQLRSPAVKNSQRYKRAGSRVSGHSNVLDTIFALLLVAGIGALVGLIIVLSLLI